MSVNYNCILILLFLIPVYANENRSMVNIFQPAVAPNSILNKPEENLNIRECLEEGYPRNKTVCNCTKNYPRKINLLATEKAWYRENTNFPCTDGNTSNVFFGETSVLATGICYKPIERLEFFHSCISDNYPKNETVCYCTYTYPQTVILKCQNGDWILENFFKQCKGSSQENLTHVLLNQFGNESNETCEKPVEFLNIFHLCENKSYPANVTSCNCTYNSAEKIDLVCSYFSSTGISWIRNGPATPCKYNFNPLKVHCFKENDTIICNCQSNSVRLDINANLTFEEIDCICNSADSITVTNVSLYSTIIVLLIVVIILIIYIVRLFKNNVNHPENQEINSNEIQTTEL